MRRYFERLYGKKSTNKETKPNDLPKETDHAATNNEPSKFIQIPKKLRSHSLSGSSSWSNKFKSLSKIGSSHEYSRPIAVPSTIHPTTNVILSSATTENASTTSSDQPPYIGHVDPINNAHHRRLKRVTTRVKDLVCDDTIFIFTSCIACTTFDGRLMRDVQQMQP